MEISDNKRFNVQKERTRLIIEFTLDRTNVYGGLVISILFFLLSLCLLSSPNPASIIFGIVTLWPTCDIFYLFIFCLYSKIKIHVDEQNLTINFHPIPWRNGNINIPTHNINKIFVKETIRKKKGKKFYAYHLTSRMINGENQKLLDSSLITKDEGLQLGNLISDFIGIEK